MLSSVRDPSQPVSGLEWTVADLGAHLVTVARRNVAVAQGIPLDWAWGEDVRRAMATVNAREITELGEADTTTLAGLLGIENEALLDAYGPDGDRTVRWPQYETRAHDATATWLGELLIHGLDLARTLGVGWRIRHGQGLAIFDGLIPALPAFVNHSAAQTAAGVYHLSLRGAHYTLRVGTDGSITTDRRKPEHADLHISARPVDYVLVGYGRANQWLAIGRGAMITWGRKPWLALRFADLFQRP
jgi:hypothetical protein